MADSRSAPTHLDPRTAPTTLLVVVGLGAGAWWLTIGNATSMSSMAQGLARSGMAMPFNMSNYGFFQMWTTMTVAMMLPTIAPLVVDHRMLIRSGDGGLAPTVSLCLGYLVVWVVTGVVPLALLVASHHLGPETVWIDRAGGAVLVGAGVYQLTPWKRRYLRMCRTFAPSLATPDRGWGSIRATRVGLISGLRCLGSCWALMATLLVVGLMNLAWMAAIAAVVVAEKNWRHGLGLTTFVAAALLGLGATVLVDPHLLGSIAFAHRK